ncbi:unnamed protein product [Rotaria sordida]|uniref:AAA+ ATPase domain-containing protein n=1 Tax=Rotaria sordida TaxID=392033 RepID=A0A813THN8_9BILA|nr:unnamed protein product [Rotaria sordida]
MSKENNGVNNVDQQIINGKKTSRTIYFYILRNTTIDERFKIKAYFNNDIKCTFNRAEVFDEKKNNSPYIYCLELNITIDDQDCLFINHQNTLLPIENYRLCLSRKIPQTDRTFRDYNDDTIRYIKNPRSTKHYFLFDVNFVKNFVDGPPGENVPFWSQLCLYTYYILRHQMLDHFNTLIDQFQKVVQETNRKLIREEFNDFFQSCITHLSYAIPPLTNQHIAEKIIIRMTGLLPITKSNFDLTSHFVINFALAMIDDIKEHYDHLFATVSVGDWPLFRDGLTLYLSIELLSKSKDTIELVHQMKNEQCKKDLANVLLQRLELLQRPVLGLNWTSLFTIVDPNILTLKQLELTRSIQTYITSLVQIVGMNITEMEITDTIVRHFDRLIYEDCLPVDLENIIFLIKFLQMESLETDESSKNILKIVNTTIESSMQLRTKIEQYLYTLTITNEQFKDIRFIISFIEKSFILFLVNKRSLLIHLLNHAYTSYSYEFFKQWFCSFLLSNDEVNDRNKKVYQDLLEHWSHQMSRSYEIMIKIMMDIDLLINAFENEQYRLIFINHMIKLCFQQESIYYIISDGLLNLNNELFLDQFKKKFASIYLNISQDKLKQLSNRENPLYHLINIDKQIQGKSKLVNDLIQLTTNKIQFNIDEILRDTFERPTRTTCIYAILFEDCFKTLTLRQIIIDQLLALWNIWEEKGFRASQILGWKKFSNEERQIVYRIWNYIGETAEKQYKIDALIDRHRHEMDEKIQIKEIITKCLEIYCQNACDKQLYFDLLSDMETKLKSEIVRSITIPDQIRLLLPLVDRLNSLEKLNAWKKFLAENRNNGQNNLSPTTDTNSPDIIDDESLLSDDKQTTEPSSSSRTIRNSIITTISTDSNEDIPLDQRSCIEILTEYIEVLDMFIARLQRICSDWKHLSISEILVLFPDIQYVDHDFEILKPLLNSDVIEKLKSILDYWKNRDNINHICHGYINLINNIVKSFDKNCEIFKKVTEINYQTKGLQCFMRYRQFSRDILQYHSKELLNFIAQYSLSNELITFLNLLASADVDNLLHAVNDWDETLINTKTVLDFVMLKRFFVRFNSEIELIRNDSSEFNIEQIKIAFQTTFEDEQFKNIFNCFQTCSASLISIKRIHLELTDKELSKRKRISDLMKNIKFDFIEEFNKFNINIDPQSMCFNDLSELRDRARLIEYSTNNNNKFSIDSQYDINELHSFVTFVEIVEKILKNFSLLNIAGHPSIINYLSPNKSFTCINSDYQELIEFSLILDNLLYDWDIYLCKMYEKHLDLTYFSYQQIWIIEDYLYNQIEQFKTNHSGYHLLQYIGIQPETINFEYLPIKTENPNERLENLGKILTAQRIKTNLKIKQENRLIKKVYLVETSDEGILRSIISLFKNFHISMAVNHLFYCTEETTWIEIRAFTYHCFYSQTLHQLIRPELLSTSIQDHFTHLLRQLIEHHPEHYFRLAIITNISTTHLQLINGLRTLQIVHIVHDQDMLNKNDLKEIIQEIINENCTLVTSRINGLGKSYLIRNEIEKKEKICIKFPISGDIDADIIAERLRDYGNELTSSKAALHIDIGAVNNTTQLNELLYCLLLFRSFRLGQVAVHIPIDVPIYIELDSSPYSINLQDKIVLFKFMNLKYIDHIDWNDFVIDGSLTIQLVVNYLQAIKDKTILTRNITEETLINFNRFTCINLLKETFLQKKNPEFVTWTQLSIFISVYYNLFSGFSRCGFFLIDSIPNPQLRLDILQTLLQSSNQFTSLCVENVRINQRSVNTNEVIIPFSEAIVRWDKTQPFTVVFSATDNPIFVYKNPIDVPSSLVEAFQLYHEIITGENNQQLNNFFPDYSKFTHKDFFLKLASLSKKYFIKSICMKCYRQYDYNQIQCTECETNELLVRPISSKTADIESFQEHVAKKLQLEYVLTPDNYIKMLLIYLRVESGLPVLIMGETGCGKTALIQFLCQKILDDEMEIFRIHAGVTSEQIINMIHKFSQRAHECLLQNKRLWVFFDEFNTTPSIGLIKEITCERTLLGEPLPDNMVLLGACNPQRRKKDNKIFHNHIGIKKDLYEIQRLKQNSGISLLYTVVPIPETMLEYVWDYGYLDDAIENKYIRTMLYTCEQLLENIEWFNLIVILISKSQKFFRDFEDVSSVSLRDVARFCRLYNWFRKSIIEREGIEKFLNNSSVLLRRSSLIALLLCYYFRLNSPIDRKNYTNLMEENLISRLPNLSKVENFLVKFLEIEQKKIIERMNLPSGTAKNHALMDNIFVLLVCIVNRIPVIICGKPGCSKTSAVQIVISNLKGKKSSNEYFQKLPELITVSYQGSQNCTSESIIKVFQRADKYLDVKKDADILPVIVFDEIGLAELSTHNPLKVLHSKLEVEICQYGFVGLSNWRLDASKMNRTLYLSCPDPDIVDLKLTAKIISDSIIPSEGQQIARIDPSIITALATSYYQLYQFLKLKEQQKYANYFGLRDFYSLIKGVVNDLIKTKNNDERYKYIRQQLTINFDGILDGSQFMWNRFCEQIQSEHLIEQYKSPTFKELLDLRLTSRQGRYLMLIAENESIIDYVERYIIVKHQPPPVRTLIGSCFSGDLISGTTYTEQYNYRVLMDIILYAETNVTLIMRRMGHLYDNLYDLFNQNFAISGKKNYCRIALGALYHPRCLVNDDFYCVVFVRKEDLAKCDPPFLNRFEKHIIDMKSLIHQRHWSITDNLLTELISLLPRNINKYFPLLQHLFVDYSNDYICNLVIDAFDNLNISLDDDNNTFDVINYCKNKLIETSSFDLLLILSLQSNQCHPLIDQYYDLHINLSFQTIIKRTLNEQILPNQIIYTYTQIYHIINYNSNEIEEVKLSIFKNELELTNKIKQHYQKKDNYRLLIIRVDYHQEHEHILLLKHILLNSKIQSTNRSVWLIFHLQRNMLNQTTNEVLFNGWSTIMINDLNEHKLIPKTILLNPSYLDLVTHPDFLLSDSMLDEIIDRCLTKFRYTVSHKDLITQINVRRNQIIEYLTITIESQSLRSIIQENLLKLIKNIQLNRFFDWRQDLLTNGILIGTCRSFNDALQSIISIYYENYLLLLFYHFEKNSFIDSFLFMSKNKNNHLLNKIWFDCLISTIKNIDLTIMNVDVIEMPLIFNLHLPCAIKEYEIIRLIRQIIIQRRDDNINEEDLMNLAIKQLRTKSIYDSNIDIIFNDNDLFRYYYNDQLLLAQDEAKIYQLSSLFIKCLLMTNQTRSINDRLRHLLIDYNELFKILRLFEISIKLIDENDFINEIFNQQLIILDESDMKIIKNESLFYKLILTDEHFCLIPPKSEISNEHIFQCEGDPFIEISLMNLIELLVSPSIIDRIDNIEQLTTTYSLVAQGILGLTHYSVNNLEKLRSFISLIRCITTLISTNKALDVFKQACRYGSFDATFRTCDDIHKFISLLQRIISTNEPNINEIVVQRTLLKLESEFLKNWLVDHTDEYLDIITLMSKSNNNLWQYSAKIFTYIDRKLQLLPMIKDFNGQLPSIEDFEKFDEDLRKLINKYQQFDEHLQQLNDTSRKIEHIMVTRIHMHLILSVNNKETIENILQEHFNQFEENIRIIQNTQKHYGLTLISLISWLKHYAQLYAFVFINDSHHAILEDIDKLLTRDDFLFCSTIKLFIIKQLCQMSNITLNDLRDIIINRNVTWIRPMIALTTSQKTKEIRRSLILPTPLFECYDEFIRVDRILTNNVKINDIRQLVKQCQIKQETFYCFIIWFIHYYARFYINDDISLNNYYQQLIEKDLSREIIDCFDLLGYKLLVLLCTNFNNNSNYFYLNSKMTIDQFHQRLIALNIIALLLSLKTLRQTSYLSSLLFDENLKMPQNYTTYLQSSICLPGLISSNPIITQMIDVRTTVKERLDRGQIHEPGKFVFQCSKDCYYMFYFFNCGVPVDRSKCPLCNRDIGAAQYGILIEREPPQIRMSIDEGFQFINNYIEQYNKEPRYGYHNQTRAIQSNQYEKSDHLNRSISYRFIHMITHVTLLFLNELSLLTDLNIKNSLHFKEHFEKDYQLLRQQLNDNEQCYIWLYKIINHMLNKDFILKGFMNTNEKVIQIEKLLEEKLLFNHIESISNEINQYKIAYNEYIRQQNQEATFDDFIDEISQDENKYPLLNFFNITNIYTSNPIDEFRIRLQTIPYGDKLYPITTFLMKRLSDYANIQYLYPIVIFTNYLIEKFNHRIKRNDASETTISYYLTHGSDCETISQLYNDFIQAWYKLNLNELQYGCQPTKFELTLKQEDFAIHTKIAMVLLNTTKDESSILLAACLRTIGQLQNEIVHFFHNKIVNDADNNRYHQNAIPIQSIRPEHILHLDANVISTKLITDGFTINYQYGKSRDIIYDYEEIEITLRNMISCLPLIDTEKLHFLNYQFELYSENTSLINDVRTRIKQESLIQNEKMKLKNLINSMQNDDILHYLGSLDYVFTYLRNIDDDETTNNSLTIQSFVENYIRSSVCLNDNVLQRPPFSTINLKYIIDLYELIEEIAFDKVLRHYIKQNLTEESFPIEQRQVLIRKFSDMTFKKETIAYSLKSIDSWIGILKRLMVRVLSNVNVSLDVPIQIYLERTDLWTGNIIESDIETFEVNNEILLQHTYIILKGLEYERDKLLLINIKPIDNEEQLTLQNNVLQNTDTQLLKVKTWHNDNISNASMMSRVIKSDKTTAKKMRV